MEKLFLSQTPQAGSHSPDEKGNGTKMNVK